jgi:hypothetical protein
VTASASSSPILRTGEGKKSARFPFSRCKAMGEGARRADEGLFQRAGLADRGPHPASSRHLLPSHSFPFSRCKAMGEGARRADEGLFQRARLAERSPHPACRPPSPIPSGRAKGTGGQTSPLPSLRRKPESRFGRPKLDPGLRRDDGIGGCAWLSGPRRHQVRLAQPADARG